MSNVQCLTAISNVKFGLDKNKVAVQQYCYIIDLYKMY